MNKIIHPNLTKRGWSQLSLGEQLGNIGSEVSRALLWRKRGDEHHQQMALDRALELFNLTISDPRWKARLKELTRAREVLVDFFFADNTYNSTAEQIDKYFYYFAYSARRATAKNI